MRGGGGCILQFWLAQYMTVFYLATNGLCKVWKSVKIRIIAINLRLNCFAFRAKWVRIHGPDVTAVQPHTLCPTDHHKKPIIRIEMAKLIMSLPSYPQKRPSVHFANVRWYWNVTLQLRKCFLHILNSKIRVHGLFVVLKKVVDIFTKWHLLYIVLSSSFVIIWHRVPSNVNKTFACLFHQRCETPLHTRPVFSKVLNYHWITGFKIKSREIFNWNILFSWNLYARRHFLFTSYQASLCAQEGPRLGCTLIISTSTVRVSTYFKTPSLGAKIV